MTTLLNLLFTPSAFLNIFGGLIGFFWLLFRGDFSALLFAIGLVLISRFAIGLLMMPSLPLAFLAQFAFKKESVPAVFLFVASSAFYTHLIMGLWAFVSFRCVLFYSSPEASLIPALLVAYTAAVGPWLDMARIEMANQNSAAMISAMGMQIGCQVLLVMSYIQGAMPTLEVAAFGFFIPMTATLIFQITILEYSRRLSEPENPFQKTA